MSRISITRRHSPDGKVHTPHRYRDGCYRVADPAFGDDKKKAAFQIRARTLEEVLSHVNRGFHLRMSAGPGTAGPALIAPENLLIRAAGAAA
jgi:hypothetical protein